MNNIFQFVFICLVIIMLLQFLRKRKYMTSRQRGIVVFLYILAILGFVALYFPNLQLMPSHYLKEWISPYVKKWATFR